MASKCKKKWLSQLRPSTGGTLLELVIIFADNNGVLKGGHVPTGKGVNGYCLGTGMSWSRPDDGTYPQYHYDGDFVGNEDHVEGTYIILNKVDGKLRREDGGDWEADKTTTFEFDEERSQKAS